MERAPASGFGRAARGVGRTVAGFALLAIGFFLGVGYAFHDLPEPTSPVTDPGVQSVLRTTTAIHTDLAELRRELAETQVARRR